MKKVSMILISLILVSIMVVPAFAQPILPPTCSYYSDGQHILEYSTVKEIISITPCAFPHHDEYCSVVKYKVTDIIECNCGYYYFSTSYDTVHEPFLPY